ncbi:MAG: amino acid-binding protein [Candidatus Hydrogenedens sp.]|nr:amino acid-binding protein [Candidatus Hydrogenedentota bacterium]NLF58207.1 amino acid-binding protein [Candidatus Hydrogenedens sp.]
MKIHQLSMFLENKPGRLSEPCRLLANAGINILTLSLADTQQFGIMRLIVRDWEAARAVLQGAGCVVNITEVVATEVEDKPGGLANILEVIEKAGLNIEYMYAFTFRSGDRAVLVFRFNDPDAAVRVLQERGINVIDSVELYDRSQS